MVWVRLVRFACCCCGQICVVLVLTCWSYWRFIIAPASARSCLPAPVATGSVDVLNPACISNQGDGLFSRSDGAVTLCSNPMLSAVAKSRELKKRAPSSAVELVPMGSAMSSGVMAQADREAGLASSQQRPDDGRDSLFRAATKSGSERMKESRPVVRRMSTRNVESAEQLTHRLGVTPSIVRGTATAFARGGLTSRLTSHSGPALSSTRAGSAQHYTKS